MQSGAVDNFDFQSCRTLSGRSERVSSGRRNGYPAILLSPVWTDGGPRPSVSYPWLDQPKYYINLNDIECQTWRQILSGRSIAAIAKDEGVSRAAIYARIEGTHGYGGMIGKNFWVLLWWRLRKQLARIAQ
jgi:hypothetical protein